MRAISLLAVLLAALLAAGCGGESGSSKKAVVWAVGDGATGSSKARALAERIEKAEPARLLYLGDVYPEGTREDFDDRYDPSYGDMAKITEPTPGNHEWENREEGYFPYWTEKKGERPREAYAFELAGWQIISVNSEGDIGPGSEQVRFLREQVRREGTCRLAFWHRPRFSAGNHGDEDIESLWNPLRGRAALVLNGHDHNTQRFAPRDGITQIIAGAGGANFYPVDRSEPGLEFAEDERLAALRLTLEPGRAGFEVVDGEGRTLDSGTVRCRPLAPA